MNTSDFIICSVCQHQNPTSAPACEKCGTPLRSSTTVAVADDLALSPVEPSPFSPQPGVFTIYVPGFGQPLKLAIKEEILLGRYQDGLPPPDVDLNPFYGYLSGVSRRHAKIKVSGSEVTLQDLGSSNGTWVNESKLLPHQSQSLKSGDIIRLGQLLMFVYFQSVELSEQTLLMRDTRGGLNMGLTPNLFSDGLLNLLNSIQEIEACISVVQDQPSPSMQIKAVSFDKERALIQAKLVGAYNAIEFSRKEISKRREALSGKLQGIQVSPEETLPPQAMVDLSGLADIDQVVKELASIMLEQFGANNLEEEKKKVFFEKIEPLIKLILTSPFEIITE